MKLKKLIVGVGKEGSIPSNCLRTGFFANSIGKLKAEMSAMDEFSMHNAVHNTSDAAQLRQISWLNLVFVVNKNCYSL